MRYQQDLVTEWMQQERGKSQGWGYWADDGGHFTERTPKTHLERGHSRHCNTGPYGKSCQSSHSVTISGLTSSGHVSQSQSDHDFPSSSAHHSAPFTRNLPGPFKHLCLHCLVSSTTGRCQPHHRPPTSHHKKTFLDQCVAKLRLLGELAAITPKLLVNIFLKSFTFYLM